jgi:hypothetical protein
MKTFATSLFSCCLFALAGVAHAETPQPEPLLEPQADSSEPVQAAAGVQEHDGFYLSLRLGPGYSKLRVDELVSSGVATDFSVSIGGVISDNLVLFGESNVVQIKNPSLSYRGKEAETEGVNISIVGIGAGLAYYVMPLNAFVAASAGLSSGSMKAPTASAKTKSGFGGTLRVGWEAWASDNWGLGVCAQFQMSSMKDTVDESTWASKTASIALSATYN